MASPNPGVTRPLDIYAGAQGAWSTRRVSSTIGFNAMDVERISDGATLVIQYGTDGELDTATLMGFLGNPTDTIAVKTWFDQSGNGNDLNQPLQNQMPRIVISGVLQTEGSTGKPTLVWTGTGVANQTNMITGGWASFGDASQFQVQKMPIAPDTTGLMFQGPVPGEYYSFYEQGNMVDPIDNSGGVPMPLTEYWIDGVQLLPKTRDGLYLAYIAGATMHYGAILHLEMVGFGTLKVGQSTITAPHGTLSEILHFNVDYTAERINITSNQQTYFGT